MTIEVAIGDSLGVWRRWAEELSLTPPDSLVSELGVSSPICSARRKCRHWAIAECPFERFGGLRLLIFASSSTG